MKMRIISENYLNPLGSLKMLLNKKCN